MTHNPYDRKIDLNTLSFRRLPLQLAVAAAMTVSLAACGGGGGSSGTDSIDQSETPATTSSSRVASIRAFLDANDVADESFEYDYGPSGLMTGLTRQYMDDGEPDTTAYYGWDADAIGIAEFNYDADNQLVGVLYTRTEGSESSVREETRTFESGLLRKIDATVTYNSVITVLANELFYNEGRLSSYTSTDQSSDGSSGDDETYTVQYGSDGKVSSLTLEVDGSEQERHDFTWRADDQLQLISSTSSADSATLEFSYDVNGQLQFTQKTLSGFGAEFNEFYADYNYTLHRKYDDRGRVASLEIDMHSDSAIDGTVVFEWEDGACVPFIDLDPEGLPGYVRNAGVPYEPGSGIVLSTYCSDK